MNIVQQLRSGGDDSFADIYAEVRWPEILPAPGSVVDDIVAEFDAKPGDRRRGFDLWGVDRDALIGPDFDSYVAGLGTHALAPMLFGFTAAWWQLCHERT